MHQISESLFGTFGTLSRNFEGLFDLTHTAKQQNEKAIFSAGNSRPDHECINNPENSATNDKSHGGIWGLNGSPQFSSHFWGQGKRFKCCDKSTVCLFFNPQTALSLISDDMSAPSCITFVVLWWGCDWISFHLLQEICVSGWKTSAIILWKYPQSASGEASRPLTHLWIDGSQG